MANKNKLLKQIKTDIKKTQEEVIKAVANGNQEKAKKDSEWITLSKKIISDNTTGNKVYVSIIIGIICLLVTGYVSVYHVKTTNVSIKLYSKNISFTLHKAWENENTIESNHLYVNHIVSVSGSLLPNIITSNQLSTMEIIGESIDINTLKFSENAQVELQNRNNTVNLFLKDTIFTGKVGLRKGIFQLNDISENIDIPADHPKQFYSFISRKEASNESIRFDFAPAKNFILENIDISKFNFLVEYPVRSGKFESTVLGGNIKIHDTNNNYEILYREDIRIEFAKCHSASLFCEDDKIVLFATGKVKMLRGGQPEESKNYKPTLLEYYYQNQRVGLLWSAFVFLIGILYSLKNLFSRFP